MAGISFHAQKMNIPNIYDCQSFPTRRPVGIGFISLCVRLTAIIQPFATSHNPRINTAHPPSRPHILYSTYRTTRTHSLSSSISPPTPPSPQPAHHTPPHAYHPPPARPSPSSQIVLSSLSSPPWAAQPGHLPSAHHSASDQAAPSAPQSQQAVAKTPHYSHPPPTAPPWARHRPRNQAPRCLAPPYGPRDCSCRS